MKTDICFFNTAGNGVRTDRLAASHHTGPGGSSFVYEISRRLSDGNELVLDEFGAAVVGGRRGIVEAFSQLPCAEWWFSAPPGKVLYASYERSAPLRGKAIGVGMLRTLQIATGPIFNAVSAVANSGSTNGFGRAFKYAMTQTYDGHTN